MIRAESRPDRIVDFIYKFFRVMEMSLRIRLIAVPTNVKTIVMNKNKTIKKSSGGYVQRYRRKRRKDDSRLWHIK